jgi:1-phosphofructokinase
MKKVITVNLNPCIDWQYSVPSFVRGELNRVRRTRTDIAGKGINVAIALKNLGLEPICTGFNFKENGAQLTEQLNTLGVLHDFIEVEGSIRVNIKLYEESSDAMTELNQSGAFVSEQLQESLIKKIEALNETAEFLILSGSRPEGVPADFDARICKTWNGKVVLDTEGEALRLALNFAPFAVKPNLFELESTYNIKLTSHKKIINFCRENLSHVKIICVSMGKDGALLISPNESFFCPALDVSAKGVAGAGDAMVAGLVFALSSGDNSGEKLLSSAMAAAAASVILDGTQMCTHDGFSEMLKSMPKIKGILS